MQEDNLPLHVRRSPRLGRGAAFRCLFFLFLWYVLTPEGASWVLGIPAVLLAVYISLLLAPATAHTLSFIGACHFLPYFLSQSLSSGIDVSRRVLSPSLPINPGLVIYSTFLPEGSPRIFFINTISLLPGTLSADLHDNKATIHTIDKDLHVWENIQNLECRVAALFSLKTTPEGEI
ncbi:MAG: Na+/H+ antiporter subunit E [Proteobacteria bacterium]|nr:Na+/H+ antiporter subunit E [Pseudomonadota bacterium]MBU1710943.1 Na+/H+ antiporter subunit E [Pseudomonadota bacterium]